MHARPLDALAATLVFALCVVWGFNQVVVKLALPDEGPIAQTGSARVSELCASSPMRSPPSAASSRLTARRPRGALAGALFTAEFIPLYESLRFTSAARATVFIYAAPFFVAVGAAFLLPIG
jgi:drug/metabolite transporter (DMT)-like permease